MEWNGRALSCCLTTPELHCSITPWQIIVSRSLRVGRDRQLLGREMRLAAAVPDADSVGRLAAHIF